MAKRKEGRTEGWKDGRNVLVAASRLALDVSAPAVGPFAVNGRKGREEGWNERKDGTEGDDGTKEGKREGEGRKKGWEERGKGGK
jgi:hypothetical protein